MRLAFAGTPQFAERALDALVSAGHELALVLTQPDRPAGRGLQSVPGPVKRFAVERGLPVFQPASLRNAEAQNRIGAAGADALVVAAYGLILPQAVLDLPRYGAINIHASLLPRWRGAAPIQRALLAGDAQTGISIMQMDAGLDTGPVLARGVVPIGAEDDAGTLHAALAELGARLIVEVVAQLPAGTLRAEPQPEAGACYAPKIDKRETVLDWRRSAEELERTVRAFRPAPGASTMLSGELIKVWRSAVVPGDATPGTLLRIADDALVVACGRGALAITELQRPGGRRVSVDAFLRGRRLSAGMTLGEPSA